MHKKRLKSTLNRFVKDTRFWEEIEKMFVAGCLFESKSKKNFQGSLLYPFLFNVYMHDFDQFVKSMSEKHFKMIEGHSNKNYNDLMVKKDCGQSILMSSDKLVKFYAKTLPNYIQYVRYLDDLLIGVVSSRQFVMHLQKKLQNFLKSNLHLKVNMYEKAHRDQFSIPFLGHMISLISFHPKMRSKNKLLEAAYRYKNKVLQSLRLEEYKTSKFRMDKLKKRVMKHIGIMRRELGLKSGGGNDTFAGLISYKFLGDTLAQNVNFHDLRELTQFLSLLNFSSSFSNSTSRKFFNVIGFDALQNRIVVNKKSQIYDVKFLKDFHIKRISQMLKKIRNTLKNKVKVLTELTISECVEIKSKQIMKAYIQQLLKNKLSKMVFPMLKKEEVYKLLAGGLID